MAPLVRLGTLRASAPLASRLLCTAAPRKIAVVLAGNGVYDGSEITEAVATLVHVSAAGFAPACFAPDIVQHHVVDHTKGEEDSAPRNVLVESARIARGQIAPLTSLDPTEYAALIVPGGFGAAKNLCNHATVAQGDAALMAVEPSLETAIRAFHAAKKPIGLCCIAPVIAAHLLKCEVTVGQAEGEQWPYGGTAGAIENYGGVHRPTDWSGVCVDDANNVVSSAAYMYDGKPHEIFESVGAMVAAVCERA